MDRQAKLVQRIGDSKQHADAIIGKDFDDRVKSSRLRYRSGWRSTLSACAYEKASIAILPPAFQRRCLRPERFQGGAEAAPAVLGHGDFRAAAVGYPKDVENAAVAGGEDARVENIQLSRSTRRLLPQTVRAGPGWRPPTSCNRSGKCSTEARRALAFKLLHQSEVRRHVAFRDRKKVAFGHRLEKMIDSLAGEEVAR